MKLRAATTGHPRRVSAKGSMVTPDEGLPSRLTANYAAEFTPCLPPRHFVHAIPARHPCLIVSPLPAPQIRESADQHTRHRTPLEEPPMHRLTRLQIVTRLFL